jgi:signal transduction histidine kinase
VRAARITSLRRALIGLGVAGLVMGVLMAVVIATSDHADDPLLEAALSLAVSWSFLGTGLFVWDRRPDNLMGPLMVAFAFSWFVSQLAASDVEGLYGAGLVLSAVPYGVLVHLLFAFPSGRLEHSVDRYFVALAYFLTVAYPWLTVLFFNPASSDICPECPANSLMVSDQPTLYDALVAVQAVCSMVGIGALIWHFVRLAREADPSERVRDAPVWWVGGITMFLIAALLATGFAPEEGNFDDYVYYVALAVLATLPSAFWFGVLRWRLTEADVVAEENVRLDAELRARLEELRESRARIVEAGYVERRRVERDLHDGAQQRLVALALDLRLARSTLERDPSAAAELLDAAADNLAEATDELRELARGIHPPVLTDRGLVAALEALAARSPLPVTVHADVPSRAPPSVETAAYFVASEALTNVARHAGAGRAAVRVSSSDDRLEVEVTDDGHGGADPASGSGLRGLEDRLSALDGSLEVESGPNTGTTVRAVIPV